ncbi:helix-turn-helix domain-containing protein [Streptomyces sp. NPDC056638]|uniref:helix-turn-helix domain-containing protein n=1 Tax=Streptomyces sp. NPDC056638 TaxID=3345887 RepID=UPI003698B881
MGRRYRWYPTIVQEQVLTGWGHTARALWNVALAQPCGRLFACVPCGHAHDADHNASVEIEARARQGPPCPSGYGGGWLGRQQHAQAPFGAESRPPAEADA